MLKLAFALFPLLAFSQNESKLECPKTFSELQKVLNDMRTLTTTEKLIDNYIMTLNECKKSQTQNILNSNSKDPLLNKCLLGISELLSVLERIQQYQNLKESPIDAAFIKALHDPNPNVIKDYLLSNSSNKDHLYTFKSETELEPGSAGSKHYLWIKPHEKGRRIYNFTHQDSGIFMIDNTPEKNNFFILTQDEEKPDKYQTTHTSSCVQCHYQESLIPLKFTLNDAFEKLFSPKDTPINNAEELNKFLKDEFTIKKTSPQASGLPLYGQREVSESIIRHVAGDIKLSSEQITKIAKASQCIECHDGKQQVAMQYPYEGLADSPKENHEFLRHFVESGYMPHKHDLNLKERKILISAILADYYGNLYDEKLKHPGLLIDYLAPEECVRTEQDSAPEPKAH